MTEHGEQALPVAFFAPPAIPSIPVNLPSGLLAKLVVEFEDKKSFELISDGSWISTGKPEKSWTENGFVAGSSWTPVRVIGDYGTAPWGKLQVGAAQSEGAAATLPVTIKVDEEELKKPIYRDGVVFVGRDTGLNPNGQAIYFQSLHGTRAYTEMDMMTPAALGRELWSLIPLQPDGRKTLLCDAGRGTVGSPSVSYCACSIFTGAIRADLPVLFTGSSVSHFP